MLGMFALFKFVFIFAAVKKRSSYNSGRVLFKL